MPEKLPNGRDLNVISLREYVEARFNALDKALEVAFANATLALSTARSHIEEIFDEHRKAHSERHTADERALQQAREVIDERLAKLNELRSEVLSDRSQFVRTDVYTKDIENMRALLTALDKKSASVEAVESYKRVIYGAVIVGVVSLCIAVFNLVTKT